jgi:molybdopterin converting factor small subunit
MSTKIKIPEYLKDKTDGQPIIDVTGNTLRECLGALVHRYPALKGEIVDGQGMLLVKWVIFINGKHVSDSDELSVPVIDGDLILLIPMVAGG